MVELKNVPKKEGEDIVVVVENLPNTINNQQLRKVFEPLGARKCRVVYRKTQFMGLAGVCFRNFEDAKKAVEAVNKTKIKGMEVICRFAIDKDRHWFKKPKRKKNKALKSKDLAPLLEEASKLMYHLNAGMVNAGGPTQSTNLSSVIQGFLNQYDGPSPMSTDATTAFPNYYRMSSSPSPPLGSPLPSPTRSSDPRQIKQEMPTISKTPSLSELLESMPKNLSLQLLNQTTTRETEEQSPLDNVDSFDIFSSMKLHVISVVSGNDYKPQEIAVSVFSLNQGEIDRFHRFVDGSNQTWSELCSFLEKSATNEKLTLWAKGPATISNLLQRIAESEGKKNSFEIREIEEIVGTIHKFQNRTIPSSSLSDCFQLDLVSSHIQTRKCENHKAQERIPCALANIHFIVHTICHLKQKEASKDHSLLF